MNENEERWHAGEVIMASTGWIGRAHALAIRSDGWMEVLWVGEFEHPLGPERVDPEDLDVCLANFKDEQAFYGSDWSGIALYVGHPESEGTLDRAPAQAWFKEAAIIDSRLCFRPTWTPAGKELVGNGHFKFISGYLFGRKDPQGVFHPEYVASIGLTNNPVMREGQHPLANAKTTRGSEMSVKAGDGSAAPSGLELLGRPNSEWSADLMAKLEALIGGAATKDEALQKLYDDWSDLYQKIRDCEAMETLIVHLGNALGASPGEDGTFTAEILEQAVAAANAAVDRATRLERELAEERAAFVAFALDQAVSRGALADTPEQRENAKTLLAADRKSTLDLWFNGRPAARANASSETDPLRGVHMAHAAGIPKGAHVLSGEEHRAVVAAANARQQQMHCSYEAAHDWAWNEFMHGKIKTGVTDNG